VINFSRPRQLLLVQEWYRAHISNKKSSSWRKLSIHVHPLVNGSAAAAPAQPGASPALKKAKVSPGGVVVVDSLDKFKSDRQTWEVVPDW
jgi:hypothetical protein